MADYKETEFSQQSKLVECMNYSNGDSMVKACASSYKQNYRQSEVDMKTHH